MSERKPGWYWCIMDGALFPIYYSGGMWWKGGHKLWEDPRIVSGRIPTPEESWQYVPKEATRDMVRAAMERGAAFGTGAHYAAMLSAAPKPEDT